MRPLSRLGRVTRYLSLEITVSPHVRCIGAVEKMQEDIRAKVFQKTTATNGPLMLRKAFKFFDNDKSGGIDPDEVRIHSVATPTWSDAVWQFHAAMSNFGLQFTAEQILCLFNTFDKNRFARLPCRCSTLTVCWMPQRR